MEKDSLVSDGETSRIAWWTKQQKNIAAKPNSDLHIQPSSKAMSPVT